MANLKSQFKHSVDFTLFWIVQEFFNKLKTEDYKSLVNSKNSRKFIFLVLTI